MTFPVSSRTQIAHAMNHESYAMIYGFNTFMSLLLQTFLTLAVSDSRGLNLDIPTQVNMNLWCNIFLEWFCKT